MKNGFLSILLLGATLLVASFVPLKKKVTTVFLIGDSTVADYTDYEGEDYMAKRHPITGWGQVFQAYMRPDSLSQIKHLIKTDSVVVADKARGGRSTRTFFEEGRWAAVHQAIKKGDVVMIQFGHNDAAVEKTERYVTVQGYKEYLRLFVNQTREKGGIPILMTPVARNYPWQEGRLTNVHGEYPQAVKEVAQQLKVHLIDLNQRSMAAFTAKGQDYVTARYFMNLPAGVYRAYPEGLTDNTHFQPEGGQAVAQLVFEGMKDLRKLQ